MMKSITILICFFLCVNTVTAQPFNYALESVPQMRQLFHDNINAAQKKILTLHNLKDSIFYAGTNKDVNLQITEILQQKINELQWRIEKDSSIDAGNKFKWLRGVEDVLTTYIAYYNLKKIEPILLGDLILSFEKAMQLDIRSLSISPVIQSNELEVGTILMNNFALKTNSGIAEAKKFILLKTCQRYPDNTLKILSRNANSPFADSLIIDFAHRKPQELYNYASASDALAQKIKAINDPLVKSIVRMANMSSGRFVFPFLDDIQKGNLTIENIQTVSENEEAYYKLLVKTQIDYERRRQLGETPIVMDALTDKLKAKTIEVYVNEINALHEEENRAIRFAKINNLSLQELYYLAVLGEEEIYTSSFVIGVYAKIIEKLEGMKSDKLFKLVYYDRYRKFIKMCAAYNTLDDFLSKMDRPIAENLMRSFVSGLDKNNSLEDAVDVADSYASIKDAKIKDIILSEVRKNESAFKKETNIRGSIIYGLLNNIYTSFDATGKPGFDSMYNMPEVYNLSNTILRDDKGRINALQFFYGDKDGKDNFNDFVSAFRTAGWTIKNKSHWIEAINNTIVPITIYANKPLDEKEGLDDEAQKLLLNYLDSLKIYPTIAIHRGHSYYVKTTIQMLPTSAKLVILGSCGGYHSLSSVLSLCPEAHIIASKQIGTGVINSELIDKIVENLKQGKDLNWPQIWKTIEAKFANDKVAKEKFDDYIPPHKNLGAIFIMAYNKRLNMLVGK